MITLHEYWQWYVYAILLIGGLALIWCFKDTRKLRLRDYLARVVLTYLVVVMVVRLPVFIVYGDYWGVYAIYPLTKWLLLK